MDKNDWKDGKLDAFHKHVNENAQMQEGNGLGSLFWLKAAFFKLFFIHFLF